MHRVYASYGFDPEGFWSITPRELVARLEGAQRRLSVEQDARAWHAWHVAALMRSEKMPPLSDMYESNKPKAQKTDEEIEIGFAQLFLAWGGDPAQLEVLRAQKGET